MRPVSEMCARTRRGSAVLLLLMLIAAAIVTQCISSNTIVAVPVRSPFGAVARRRQDGAVGFNLGSW